MGFTELLVEHIITFMQSTGYASVLILMIFESMVLPVPSEAVLPFAGFLIASGTFSFTGVIIFSTVGSIIGSTISYYIGAWGGRPILEKYGKFLLLDKHHLDMTEKYFSKKGDITIFISRFIPVVRHLISIPAGMGRMNLGKFLIYTTIGACLWNGILAYIGYVLKNNWKEVMKYSHVIDLVVVAGIGIVVCYVAYKIYTTQKKKKALKV